jgi:transcriptional regulator with XRE-family HTH domain
MPVNKRVTDWLASLAAFSARLRETREARGITRKELAEQLNVTPSSVWNWENQYAQPKPETLAHIASIFGVTEGFLRNGADANRDETIESEPSESFPSIVEAFRQKAALTIGVPASRVRVSVEFLSG